MIKNPEIRRDPKGGESGTCFSGLITAYSFPGMKIVYKVDINTDAKGVIESVSIDKGNKLLFIDYLIFD